MKLFYVITAALVFSIVTSCTSSDKKVNENDPVTDHSVKTGKKKLENFKPQNVPAYKIYPITVGDTFSIYRNIEKPLAPDTIHIKIERPGTIKGMLFASNNKANLRFEKLIEPSGKMEGPFSKSFSYKIERSETIMVLVNASQMAEAAYSGPYRVHLELVK